MKKYLVIALAAVMTFMFAACGGGGNADLSDSKYVGSWKADTVAVQAESGSLEGEYIMTLNEDGTGTLTGEDVGEDETSTFTWSPTNDGFKTKGDVKLTFTDDGDNIKASLLGVELIFTRVGEEEEEEVSEGAKYGYSGEDPAELAVYKYMEENIAKEYSEAEYSVAYGIVIDEEEDDDEVALKGAFYVDNYNLEDDTMKFVSGGSHPGCFHLKKNDDGSYEVTSFDAVGDGSEFETTAKEIFGDAYEDFMATESDDELKADTRVEAVSTYVEANEIPATKYQDEGWDPVDLDL